MPHAPNATGRYHECFLSSRGASLDFTRILMSRVGSPVARSHVPATFSPERFPLIAGHSRITLTLINLYRRNQGLQLRQTALVDMRCLAA